MRVGYYFIKEINLGFKPTTSVFGFMIILLAVQLFHASPCNAQFTEITEVLEYEIIMPPNVYGSAISFYDIDGNGWDDLTISSRTGDPHFFLNFNGELTSAPFEIVNFNNAHIVGMLWGDIDNDGDADLLITKKNSPVELYINDGEFSFTNATNGAGLPQGSFNFKGAAFCDYDHDGFLDVYITKYYHPNEGGDDLVSVMLKNQGNGTFTEVTQAAGVYLPPRPSFQPVFMDVNGDGWEDLYIAIDRVEFPNELFLNNGDGTFTNITTGSGADVYVCSMTATVGDYDHDNDLDIYVTSNPTTDNVLLRNAGSNSFENVIDNFPGLEVGWNCWGSMWLDFDNDAWEDLFVGTMAPTPTPIGNQFFKNENSTTFSNVSNFLQINLSPSEAHVCAKGDLNNDGFEDFAITNRNPHPSRVFLNNGGQNRFIGVSLEGVIANRDGVGTWIHCYAGGEHYSKFTLSGENLYGQNSSRKVFGLGSTTQVDSMVIEWNSGTRDVYYNPAVDQYHHYIEGSSFALPFSIHPQDTVLLCTGDTLELNGGDYESYNWNTGHDGPFLSVTNPGTYSVEVINSWGVLVESLPVVVQAAPESTVELSIDEPSCFNSTDGSIFLTLNTASIDSIAWSTGESLPFIDELAAGTYAYQLSDQFGCWKADTIQLLEPEILSAGATIEHVGCYGENSGNIQLQIDGGTPPWETDWEGVNPDSLSAGEYAVLVTDWNGCEWNGSFTVQQPDSLWIDLVTYNQFGETELGAANLTIYGGTLPYDVYWSTGVINTDSLPNLTAGNYNVQVEDDQGCLIDSSFEIMLSTHVSIHRLQAPVVYPNPFTERIQFKNCRSHQGRLELFNQQGQLVLRMEKFNCSNGLFVPQLSPGIYILRLVTDRETHTFRLDKSR